METVSETARLSALQQLGLLDTDPSESFDRITRMASQIFSLPIAAVSLTDSDRQRFKSRVGVDQASMPRDEAPCAKVVDTGALLVVPDLLADPDYHEGLLAQSGIRFYAGAPLVTREGFCLGAICVLGIAPRAVTEAETTALRDLAAMVMAQIELQHAFGRIDPLSGQPNRTQFQEDLEDLARNRPDGETYVAVVVEFATSNELNHATVVFGPTYLEERVRESGAALRGLLGVKRKLYQVALNQFAFLSLPGVEETSYVARLEFHLDQVRRTAASRFTTTTVVGVAPFALGSTRACDVLRIAQSAAQDARATGRTLSLYSVAHDAVLKRRFALLADFGRALEQTGQLRLVYQPRVDLASGRCVSVEALLRWRHPLFGDISPAEFIPIVEQTPMARAMTTCVLKAAVRQLAAWRGDGLNITVSINVSVSNLREGDLFDRVHYELARQAVPPPCLELEITETAVMSDAANVIRQLQAIADSGVRVAIDDFGTGYSSLSYLQKLPADTLKIDRSFIQDCDTDHRKRSLIAAMITLGHDFDFTVVAEGAETQAVVDCVAALGCDEMQGYFFARPLEAEAFRDWFAAFRYPGAKAIAA